MGQAAFLTLQLKHGARAAGEPIQYTRGRDRDRGVYGFPLYAVEQWLEK